MRCRNCWAGEIWIGLGIEAGVFSTGLAVSSTAGLTGFLAVSSMIVVETGAGATTSRTWGMSSRDFSLFSSEGVATGV
jgi:hypothetical protein